MSHETIPIAPVRLARSLRRIALATLVLVGAGAAAIAGGVTLGGAPGIVLAAAGGAVVLLAVYLLALLLSVRLEVEVAALHVRWLGGDRRYALARGAVTRVAVSGRHAVLRPHFGALGWAFGRATLRGEERVELIRLAPTRSVILVPTDHLRLAIAPAVEADLLAALAAAARVQQRLDEVAAHTRTVALPLPQPRVAPVVRAVEVPPPDISVEPRARVLTGIERAILEERLASERAASLAAAEVERQTAAEAEGRATAEVERQAAELARAATEARAAAAEAPASPARVRRRMTWQRPGWTRALPGVRLPAGSLPPIPGDRLVVAGLLCLPAVAAAGIWIGAGLIGRTGIEPADLRHVALALLVGGPVTALGGLVARTWFPRFLGLVLVSAFAGLLLAGRALLA